MALLTLPASVKVAEARMFIGLPTEDEYQSQITLRGMRGPAFREVWFLSLAFAGMSHETARALSAAVEAADGRAGILQIDMLAGVMTRAPSATAAFASAPARGADFVSLNITGDALPAGCLLGVGDIENGPYQLLEVLEDAAAGSGVSVRVAPRIRRGFTTSTPIAVGAAAKGRFTPAQDDTGKPRFNPGLNATGELQLVEAV